MNNAVKCPKHTTGGGPCYCQTKSEAVEQMLRANPKTHTNDVMAATTASRAVVSKVRIGMGLAPPQRGRTSNLKESDVPEVRRRYEEGESFASLGKSFSCSPHTIRQALGIPQRTEDRVIQKTEPLVDVLNKAFGKVRHS